MDMLQTPISTIDEVIKDVTTAFPSNVFFKFLLASSPYDST